MEKDIFDFGFSSSEEIELERDTSRSIHTQEIMAAILPFLEKLKGGKDDDMIRWRGKERHKQIDEFIKKLQKIAGNDLT